MSKTIYIKYIKYVCIYIHIQCVYIYNDCNVMYECSENVIFVNEDRRESDALGFGLNIDIFLKEQKYIIINNNSPPFP